MKQKSILVLVILFYLPFLFAQSQLSTDTSVKVFPHWQKGEPLQTTAKTERDLISKRTKEALCLFVHNRKDDWFA
jgi:hypothetical protein